MLKRQPGTVDPEEYDWERQFAKLDTKTTFTLCDTGKVLGLALAYKALKEEHQELIDEVKVMGELDES